MPTATAAETPRTFRELAVLAGFRSLTELGVEVGVSHQAMHYVSRGYRPSPPLRKRLCRALQVTECDLLAAIAFDRPARNGRARA